jgi:hypothetical protein
MRHAKLVAVAICLSLLGPSLVAASPVDDLRGWLAQPADHRPALAGLPFAAAPLSKGDAATAQQLLWDDHVATIRATRQAEWAAKAIQADRQTLRLLTHTFGNKPAGGWNLFISMHGGGNAPPQLNDSQWRNQIRLYAPPDSLVIAPRAPTNDWDLWHKPEVDDLFDRLIEDAVVLGEVNVNRVYLMGYSAGGDGVYQLAPRMADRWAAASMMAGHPNDASPLSLRDLPFTIHVGALDGGAQGYHRNEMAMQWGQKLDALQKGDPGGYVHWVKLHDGKPHWMDREDAEALPWMLKFTRDPLPAKVVWMQSNVVHDRLYWLATPHEQAKGGQLAIVSHDGQRFDVEKVDGGLRTLTVMLNDKLVDLDQPITVRMGGKPLFAGTVQRTVGQLARTLGERGDPDSVFSVAVTVTVGG